MAMPRLRMHPYVACIYGRVQNVQNHGVAVRVSIKDLQRDIFFETFLCYQVEIQLFNSLSFSCYDFHWFPYLAVLIRCIGGAVAAVGNSKIRNPLIVFLSSLDFYSCHFGFAFKIDL